MTDLRCEPDPEAVALVEFGSSEITARCPEILDLLL